MGLTILVVVNILRTSDGQFNGWLPAHKRWLVGSKQQAAPVKA